MNAERTGDHRASRRMVLLRSVAATATKAPAPRRSGHPYQTGRPNHERAKTVSTIITKSKMKLYFEDWDGVLASIQS
jgi:hypothetical protein